MRAHHSLAAVAAALLALSACRQAPPAAENQLANPAAATTTRPPAPAPQPGAGVATDLARYDGAYPFDQVEGRRFLDEPAVRDAVRRLAPDLAVVARVFNENGPRTPIRLRDGKLLSWGCETHNCGAHNWTVLIAPGGSDAQLCYKPDGQSPRWYGADPVGAPKDACPSGDVG